jgi:radical SAM superfamily enzyme YgiQ (UPF0313 family)
MLIKLKRRDRMSNADYNVVYKSLFKEDPPKSVTWETSQADIFSQGRGFMEGFDFTMQLQVGCPGGCLFCYVPPTYNLTPSAVRGKQGRTWGLWYAIRKR